MGQLRLSDDGRIRDNVQQSIDILRTFEPADGYYLAFSGGKDSQCVYHLAKMAGVHFDAHYRVTSVDPPELVQFIKKNYPDVSLDIPHDRDGNPISMWNLIPRKYLPPTRIARYCCESLKESGGMYRVTLTGVRKSESSNRMKNQGLITFPEAGKKKRKEMENMGANFTKTKRGGVVLNYDNDISRNVVDMCYRTTKTMVNPIIDWTEQEVWDFLNRNGIEHCCLYDEGFRRLGCIGCPMSRKQAHEFERWPKYRAMYIRSFERMLEKRREAGLPCENWTDAEDVMKWWIT